MANRIKGLHTQRGAAIIVALFTMSLAAAAAVAMMVRLNVDIHRTELLLNATQAKLYADGSVLWAINQLNTNLKNQKPSALTDKTPIQSPEDTRNGYHITSTIEDYQNRFNLNALTSNEAITRFIKLIQTVDPKITPEKALEIAQALGNWIAPTSNNTPFDEFYAKATPPYRSAHTNLVSISELRLVKGVTAELFEALKPYVSTLPNSMDNTNNTLINVNNAPAPVLMTLSPSLTEEGAAAIIAHRKQTPFLSAAEFAQFPVAKNNNITATKVIVMSTYFLVTTQVTLGQQTHVFYTLLQRNAAGSQAATIILWQTQGTL